MTRRGPIERDFRFASVSLHDISVDSAADKLSEAATRQAAVAVHLCNAFTLSLAVRDEEYRRLLNHRAYNLVDGTPVAWFFSVLRRARAFGPVRGPSLMRAMLAREQLDHFLLGGTDETLRALEADFEARQLPGRIVGAFAPPFDEPTAQALQAMALQIRESRANVVWVGLGTPKQDRVIARLVDLVPAVYVGVGAAFDFLSGQKQEAPMLLHGTGLEWLFRFATEPRRLWRRYLVGNTVFALHAMKEIVGTHR